jgi:hypothetical protein
MKTPSKAYGHAASDFQSWSPCLALYIYIKPKEMLKLGKNTRLHFN